MGKFTDALNGFNTVKPIQIKRSPDQDEAWGYTAATRAQKSVMYFTNDSEA